ncbi:uncharacterized protein LOC130447553 [Diorhabda sublineata]|uniref:uncharacterized protein LOC130447553 n=1 Tax=Diorhabda sublineata TaxID=1163346 RepID=UPI0024E0CF2C|nr:uncharacterized protein LOC130447553 [Diorhabda sublineata]XP_056640407.1 uncharacterized protein LOC130447553 [Diorhabda sublineata]
MDEVTGSSNTKPSSRKFLSKEEKQMVYRVYKGLKCTLPTIEAVYRCSFLTGVSVATVFRIMNEKKVTGTVQSRVYGRKKKKLDSSQDDMILHLDDTEQEPNNVFTEELKLDIEEHHLDETWKNLQDNDQNSNDTTEFVSVKEEMFELASIKQENDELVLTKQENNAVDKLVKQEIGLIDELVQKRQENDITIEIIQVEHENGAKDHSIPCINSKRKAIDYPDGKSDFVSVKNSKPT